MPTTARAHQAPGAPKGAPKKRGKGIQTRTGRQLYLDALALLLRDSPEAYDARAGVGYYSPQQVMQAAQHLWDRVRARAKLPPETLGRSRVNEQLRALARKGVLRVQTVENASPVGHGIRGNRYRLDEEGDTPAQILQAYLDNPDNPGDGKLLSESAHGARLVIRLRERPIGTPPGSRRIQSYVTEPVYNELQDVLRYTEESIQEFVASAVRERLDRLDAAGVRTQPASRQPAELLARLAPRHDRSS